MMIKWVISSSCLILFIIFLRHLFKEKISLRLQYALWALVAVRLLIPFNLGNSMLSIENLTNHLYSQSETQTTVVQNEPLEFTRDEYTVKIYDRIEANKNVISNVNELKSPEMPQSSSSPSIDITQILLGIWIAGIVILSVVFLLTNIFFAKKVRKLREKIVVPYTNLPLYKSDEVQTPCLVGVFHPSIYVTRHVAENDDILRHAVFHEMTHYKQGDLYWAVVRCVCLTIHWYNPLVWWASKLSKQDAELACDEATIKKLGEEERLAYGKTLIQLTCEKRQDLFVTATTMASEKKTITERIRLIAKKPRFTMYALLLVVLAAIIAVIGTFTSAANKESEELPVSVEKCILNVNDALYYGTDETGPMGDSGCVAGNIRSTVDSGEVPLNNEESNFGCIGNPYTYDEGDGSIMVLMQDEEWHWFHISEYYNARPGNPCKNPEIAGWDLNNVKDVRADFNSMFPTPEEGTENYTYLLGQTERYYHLYGKGDYQTMLLEMDGKYAEINYPYASNYMELPELMEADVDQDGQTELFIILWLQKGTGLHIENLLLADFDDNDQLYVYQFLEEDYTAQLAENLSYEKTEDGIQPLVNGKPAGIFAKHLEDMEPFEAASVGNQMRFYYDKLSQEIKLSGQIMLLIDGHPGGLWGNYNDVTATVQWNGEYFYLTDFTSKNRLLDEQVEFALQEFYGVSELYYVNVQYDSAKMNQETMTITAEIMPKWTDSRFDYAEIHIRRSEEPSSTSGWDIEDINIDAASNAEKIISESESNEGIVQDEVYGKLLKEMLESGAFPVTEGAQYHGDPYKNYYAVMDIDEDGQEELLINFPNAKSIAGMVYYIYDYDRITKEVYIQHSGYPSFTVYDNGYIKENASHNHGRSNLDKFWPYLLYKYNPATDLYEIVAFVDAWQERIYEDIEPDPDFPKDKDLNGDGVVYYDMSGDYYDPAWIIDNEEYARWCKQYNQGNEKEIQWSLIITE